NHLVNVVVVPAGTPLSVGSPYIVAVKILGENVKMQSADLGVGVSSSYAKRVSTSARSDPQGAMPASFPVSLSSKRKEIMGSSVGGSKRKRLGFFSDRASSPILWGGVLGLLVSWLALRRVRMSTLSCSLFSDQHPGLVTSFKHRPDTLSFLFPMEPFDVSLQSRLSCYPTEFQTF
nr:hypothetical protein [Tanacetum cinerariifolium]